MARLHATGDDRRHFLWCLAGLAATGMAGRVTARQDSADPLDALPAAAWKSARTNGGASRLSQPPSGVDFPVAIAGDNREIWRWFEALPLPPPKSWWLDWSDALPHWLGGASEWR